MSDWLTNQAPAIVILCVIAWQLWNANQKLEATARETTEWRTSVRSRLDDIDSELKEQSRRISQVEYLVGLMRGKDERTNKKDV